MNEPGPTPPSASPCPAGCAALRAALTELNGPLYERYGKRLFDLAGAGAGLVTIAPLLGALAGLVYATSGRPVFFRQERVGRHRRVFRIFKFRTMVPDAVAQGRGYYIEADDPRITRCGAWLRATSLDELPQLFNVLRGEMSLVGPRPNLVMVVERYGSRYDRIVTARPGVTGLVAIRGRNRLRRSEMIALDDEYVARITMLGDLRILLETVPAVVLRRGASDDVTEEFIEDIPPVSAS